jgi:hypothetical protein
MRSTAYRLVSGETFTRRLGVKGGIHREIREFRERHMGSPDLPDLPVKPFSPISRCQRLAAGRRPPRACRMAIAAPNDAASPTNKAVVACGRRNARV